MFTAFFGATDAIGFTLGWNFSPSSLTTLTRETDREWSLGKHDKNNKRFGTMFEMVEPRGFEPLTPTMPLWCSTN